MHGNIFQYIAGDLKTDEDVTRAAIKCSGGAAFRFMSDVKVPVVGLNI